MDREMKLTLMLMAFICFLAWGSFMSLKDEIRTSQQIQNQVLEWQTHVSHIGENLDRIEQNLDAMPDYSSELEAVWREINRLSNR